MKIGIICYPAFGGSGIVATELGVELAKQGHEIHFIVAQQPVRLSNFVYNVWVHQVQLQEGQYPVFTHQPYEWALISKIVEVALQHDLDCLHVHYAIPHASAAYMAKQILADKGKRLPFLTTLHGTDITLLGQLPLFKSVIEFAINHSDAVSAVSESLKKDTLRHFDIHKPIHVVYNFIDTNAPTSAPCVEIREKFLQDTPFCLAHVSNFRKVKRTPEVVQIFAKLRKKRPCKLLMAGDGPEKLACEQLAKTLNCEKDILFLGNISCVDAVLALADAFILPSEQESFGLAALEAMAAGCVVISSDAGGIPEVNRHEQTGYVLPIGAVDQMVEALDRLAGNPALMNTMKHNARARAASFSVGKIIPQYIEIYQKITKK